MDSKRFNNIGSSASQTRLHYIELSAWALPCDDCHAVVQLQLFETSRQRLPGANHTAKKAPHKAGLKGE